MSLFCYLIFLSFSPFFVFAQLDVGKSKVGEKCERDFHCIDNAFCRAQMTCLCEPNYLPVPDFSICVPTVGLFCGDGTTAMAKTCELMSNAECRQNVCACQENFTVDITNSSNCLARPMAENDRCQRNDECIDNLDRALCINNYCQCLTNHHYSSLTKKCVRSAAIYQPCEDDSQCYMAEMGSEAADALQCVDKICKCKSGITSKHCSGASSNTAKMMTAIFFILFAIYLM